MTIFSSAHAKLRFSVLFFVAPGMIRSLFILSSTGDVIIEKHWRGLLTRAVVDHFWSYVTKAPSPEEVLPVIPHSKFYFIHIQHRGLFLLAVVQAETPPLLVIDLLNRAIEIFVGYFKEVTEDSIKENFTTIYQLLDEMVDDGFPFNTDSNTLQDMIRARGVLSDMWDKIPESVLPDSLTGGHVAERLPDSTGSVVRWRRTGVKYTTNEIYLDIVEEIDSTIDPNGMVVTQEINGTITANCRLSGMPDMTLTFVNPRIVEDASFHECVRYQRWEQNKVVSFIPPDGAFQLMKYRVGGQIQMPLYCKPQITFSMQGGGRVNVMVGTKANKDKAVEEVVVTIPFPRVVSTVSLTASHGKVHFDEVTKICRWEVGTLPKDAPLLQGSVSLTPGALMPDGSPTVSVDFKITGLAVSGLKVDSLQLLNENYKPWKGVRSVTKQGKFQVRS